ncbi:MAG: type II toxin-antitoxin system RelB/DinJ family antitoxin [Bifidobacterium bifidum]
MASIPTTTMRIDPQLKEESSRVLEDLGLTLSGAVTIFLKAVVREQGLPFEVKKGNVEWQIRSSASKTSVLKTCADSEVTP